MREREPAPYWNQDHAIGEGRFYGELYAIRARVHRGNERYFSSEPLIEVAPPPGEMVYFQASAYVLEPQISLTVALDHAEPQGGAIGSVESSTWEGMRHREIGKGQAWYYPADRVLVLWELFLHDWCREADPVGDPNLVAAWDGFERVLVDQLRGVERIVTPAWEDTYPDDRWRGFLEARGYRPLKQWVRTKEVARR